MRRPGRWDRSDGTAHPKIIIVAEHIEFKQEEALPQEADEWETLAQVW
jgi:hypothetical protein